MWLENNALNAHHRPNLNAARDNATMHMCDDVRKLPFCLEQKTGRQRSPGIALRARKSAIALAKLPLAMLAQSSVQHVETDSKTIFKDQPMTARRLDKMTFPPLMRYPGSPPADRHRTNAGMKSGGSRTNRYQ